MLFTALSTILNFSCSKKTQQIPLRTTVDLTIGEQERVKLSNGIEVNIALLSISDSVDKLTSAVRLAKVKVLIDNNEAQLIVANYNLPVTVGNVQVDCPVTKAYLEKSSNLWGLEKDARIRIWPRDSPLIAPGTYIYPIRQRFLANYTQTGNEPVYVNGGEIPNQKMIYYHAGLDFGGSEGRDEVLTPVDGTVITAGKDSLAGYNDKLDGPGYDAVYILDNRGWFHGFFHLFSIDHAIHPGVKVKMGQKIGLLGKEGVSGGWSHLHYEIICKQPSGKWGFEDAYPYIWEAYTRQYKPTLIALARPHIFTQTGEKVTLDGSKSKSFKGEISSYEWSFCNGLTAIGAMHEMVYNIPGTYSEVLKVTDSKGNIDYDYTIVQVVNIEEPEKLPPSIHATYYPSIGIKTGDQVIFGVRTFRTNYGHEEWNFNDGSKRVITKSEIPQDPSKGKYAETEHRFKKPGHYLVRVERTNKFGYKSVGCLHVEVGDKGYGNLP